MTHLSNAAEARTCRNGARILPENACSASPFNTERTDADMSVCAFVIARWRPAVDSPKRRPRISRVVSVEN